MNKYPPVWFPVDSDSIRWAESHLLYPTYTIYINLNISGISANSV